MAEELQAIVLAFDLVKWSLGAIAKFPRSHRFVLGERMERRLYDILERLVEAKYTRDKAGLLRRVNLDLTILRFQVRLASELGFLGKRLKHDVAGFLEHFRLRLHPGKTQVFPVRDGVGFLGFRFTPAGVRLLPANVLRFRRRLQNLRRDYARGAVDAAGVHARVQGWIAHASWGDTARSDEQERQQRVPPGRRALHRINQRVLGGFRDAAAWSHPDSRRNPACRGAPGSAREEESKADLLSRGRFSGASFPAKGPAETSAVPPASRRRSPVESRGQAERGGRIYPLASKCAAGLAGRECLLLVLAVGLAAAGCRGPQNATPPPSQPPRQRPVPHRPEPPAPAWFGKARAPEFEDVAEAASQPLALKKAREGAKRDAAAYVRTSVKSTFVDVARAGGGRVEDYVDSYLRTEVAEEIFGAEVVRQEILDLAAPPAGGDPEQGSRWRAYVRIRVPEELLAPGPDRWRRMAASLEGAADVRSLRLAAGLYRAMLRRAAPGEDEDLTFRLADLEERSGESDQALTTLQAYLARHGDGASRAAEARRSIDRLEQKLAGGPFAYLEGRLLEAARGLQDEGVLRITKTPDAAVPAGKKIRFAVTCTRELAYGVLWIDPEGLAFVRALSDRQGRSIDRLEQQVAVDVPGEATVILLAAEALPGWFEEGRLLPREAVRAGGPATDALRAVVQDLEAHAARRTEGANPTLWCATMSFRVTAR